MEASLNSHFAFRIVRIAEVLLQNITSIHCHAFNQVQSDVQRFNVFECNDAVLDDVFHSSLMSSPMAWSPLAQIIAAWMFALGEVAKISLTASATKMSSRPTNKLNWDLSESFVGSSLWSRKTTFVRRIFGSKLEYETVALFWWFHSDYAWLNLICFFFFRLNRFRV